MSSRALGLSALAMLGFATLATAQDTVVIAPSAPPPARTEIAPPPPAGTQMVWQSGHWSWNGTTWVWTDGRYVAAPQPTAVWEPGHWEPNPSGGYAWVNGHWRG